MIEHDGLFIWTEDTLFDGMRQDVSDATPHCSLLRNMNWRKKGTLTKDRGMVQFANAVTGYSRGGYDAHFNDGTQRLVHFVDDTSAGYTLVYVYSAFFDEFRAEAVHLAEAAICPVMFNNQLILIDGTSLNAWDKTTWTTPGTADVNSCTFGVVYANRLILFGDPAYPFYFYPSGVGDPTDWDADLAYRVTGTQGEFLTGAGLCGDRLLVGGRTFLRSFYLGTASVRDWDWDAISDEVGPVNWQSFTEVTRAQGNETRSYTFFWSSRGPVMVAAATSGVPVLVPLWEPIQEMVWGHEYDNRPGLDLDTWNTISSAYAAEYDEVRFAVKDTDGSVLLLCVNVSSAIQSAPGSRDSDYPLWRIRDNADSSMEIGDLINVTVDPETDAPSVTGVARVFATWYGYMYQMDADALYCRDETSGGYALIPTQVNRDGYDGADDNVRERMKTCRGAYVRFSQAGNYDIVVHLLADQGSDYDEGALNLSGGSVLWTDKGSTGMWGDGTMWNRGASVREEADVAVLGRSFQIGIRDDGAVPVPFELLALALHGYVEGYD